MLKRNSATMMTSAAMLATGAFVVVLTVVAAHHVGIVVQRTGQQRIHSGIGITTDTTKQLDSRQSHGSLSASSNSTADQYISSQGLQYAGQRAVAAAIGVHHLLREDFPILYLINLKLFGVAKMLKNLPIFKGNCNFHGSLS